MTSYEPPNWDELERKARLDPEWQAKYGNVVPSLERHKWTNWDDWSDTDPPPKLWTVPELIPQGHTCLFSGHGGTGKSSIALSLCAAHVLGKDWMGTLPEPGPAFFIDAEDDPSDIHRRLIAITQHYHVSLSDLRGNQGLYIMSLVGEDPTICRWTGKGLERTKLFEFILREAQRVKPKQIVIANSSNVACINEINRGEVGVFIHALNELAITGNSSVILISHPSRTGLNDKSGYSGSTQWYNAVRAQLYLSRQDDTEEDTPNTPRQLESLKNQYGPERWKQVVTWQAPGLFLPVKGLSDLERAARDAKIEDAIYAVLRTGEKTGQNYSANQSARNYLLKSVIGFREDQANKVLRKMLEDRKLKIADYGPPSRGWQRIEII